MQIDRRDNARHFRKTRRGPVRHIVLHSTAGGDVEGTIRYMNRAGGTPVSYHYLIKKNGEIIRMLPPESVAFHAGISAWPHRPKGSQSLNDSSIGIAFESRNTVADPITLDQITSARWLVTTLAKRFGVTRDNIIRHRDCSPGRKTDPIPDGFDWDAFKSSLTVS